MPTSVSVAAPSAASTPAQAPSGGSALRVALWVALAHAVTDAYAAFLPPLLPRIMRDLGLSVSLAATLVTIFSLSQSALQPVAGHLAERIGRRPFVIAGPVLGGVFLSLIGWAGNLPALIALLMLGGLGSAAFHPPGAAMAARVADGGRTGRRLAIFSFAGAAGFAAGPMIAVGVVGALGMRGLAWAMVPGLLLIPLLMRVLPAPVPVVPGRRAPDGPPVLRLLAGPLGLVFAISALSAFVQRVFLAFAPMIVSGAGRSETAGAAVLTVYMAAQAFGTLAGGALTDRMDRGRLLMLLTGLTVPAHLLAFGLPPASGPALIAAAAAGFLNMAVIPPVVILAQELMPGRASVASGLAMGFAWATGTLLLVPAGLLGDLVGPRTAALAVVPVLLVGTLLAGHPALRSHPAGAR